MTRGPHGRMRCRAACSAQQPARQGTRAARGLCNRASNTVLVVCLASAGAPRAPGTRETIARRWAAAWGTAEDTTA